MSQPFVGEIKLVGFNFAPRGYAFANGATLNIASQQALFALIGTFYGGNGTTTFQLPNLQGRTPIGYTTNNGTNPFPTSPVSIGAIGGAQSVQLTNNQLPTHTHTATTTVTPSTTPISAVTNINVLTAPSAKLPSPVGNLITVPTVSGAGTPVNAFAAPGTGTAGTMATGAATTTISGGVVTATGSTTLATAGLGQPFSTLSPYMGANYIIALVGIFPSRN